MNQPKRRSMRLASRCKECYRKYRNGLRTAFAVILTLTLVVQCGLIWARMLPEDSLSLSSRQETMTDNSAGAMPIRFAARGTEGLYGVEYNTDGLQEAYEATAAVWAQALEQAEVPSAVHMDTYSKALTRQMLMIEYDGDVPVDILAGWLGCEAQSLQDCTLGTMVLCREENNRFQLYFRDGQKIRCAATRVEENVFDAVVRQFEPNGCKLAAEEGQTAVPDLLYGTEQAVFEVMSFHAYSGSDGMELLLEAFGMDAAAAQQKAYQTDDETVYVSGSDTIRLSDTGSLEYRGTGVSVKTAQGHDRLMQYVQTAYRITGEALEAMDSGAAPALLRAESRENGRYVVDFGMQINSVPADNSAGYFARYVFDDGTLVQAKMSLRTCESTGESIAVMPVRQAAASQVLDADMKLSLRYVDTAHRWNGEAAEDDLWNADSDMDTDQSVEEDTGMDTADMPAEDADIPWDEMQDDISTEDIQGGTSTDGTSTEDMTQDTTEYDNTAVSAQWYVIRRGSEPVNDTRKLSPEEITVVQPDFDRLIRGGGVS